MPYIPEFSYEDHLTYKIQKNDTLLGVAKQLDIRPENLRSFHNKLCPLQDLIEADFPKHLQYVILAPEKIELSDSEREQIRKKAVFHDAPFRISLNHAQVNTSYGVLYTIESGETTNTIKQQVNVKWKAKSENGYYFFEIDRMGKVYNNDSAADSMTQDIAEKASAALYPLLVVVDENGKWVHINNFSEIQERWQKVKNEIRKYYKGDQIEKYFAIYDRNLEDEDTLYISLSKDWFLNAFFNGIHVQYPSTLSIEKEISFPGMAKSENINYNVQQKLNDYLDIDDFLLIDINGKLFDDRTKTDFEHDLSLTVKEYSEEKPEGKYRAKYFLNPQNYMPESIFISCDLKLDTPQKYTVTISNLDDKKEMSTSPKQELFIGESKPQKKWWQF